jgi:Fic family protein
MFSITHNVSRSLTEIERARGFLEAANLSSAWISKMQNKALILEAHYTTHIEGTQLTLEQSKQIWKSGKYLDKKNQEDAKELLNYKKAFDFLLEYIEEEGPVTEGLIREIHKKLVLNVRGNSASPGNYRKIQNYVVNQQTQAVIYTPPPVFEITQMMKELTDWINNEITVHPVLIAGIAQFQLVHIHPFLDGNGRTARLLSTLCLYKKGYDFKKLFTLSEYYDKKRLAYYQAIQSVRDNMMDMTKWLEYFTKGLAEQLREVKALGEQVITRSILNTQFELTLRQKKIMQIVEKRKNASIQDLQKMFHDVPRRTLQRDLYELVSKNILERKGETNKLVYVQSNMTSKAKHH